MERRQHLIDDYRDAMANEQRLYALVKGKGPGTADFDLGAWQTWLAAVERTTAASKALREGFSDVLSLEEKKD
ncbi:hypothetical protein [Ramlibacter albus]|uniref:Uncharacterized protein n=1 Tax=Ramlibacter albus TaxID=2079448 RepID=A0A923M5J8_9BURK|nr:hypothetical protein [Ramlibacter albus]MBC5763079.1 hypothetical protein [Ramlibacter albus]